MKLTDRSIYLINPREATVGWHGMEMLRAWGLADTTNMADLSTPTIAAMVPKDWAVSLCDERIDPVDFDTSAAVIGLTGKSSQRKRIGELAAIFRERGKLVVVGGPAASLTPDELRPHADILVTGELEAIAATLFGDIAAGTWSDRYEGGRPDLRSSPVPRWDLYPTRRALRGQIQTSRGCPFECEFCDVIQYLGRKQRWKDPDQVLAELEALYVRGYRHVLLADDNFTVMRRRTTELLERIVQWNAGRLAGPMHFTTQLSIDLAQDPDLLALCVKANLRSAFIGIETPNTESLAETLKRQNLRVDLAEEVRKLTRGGMMVMAGMIAGFDHDGPDIFERLVGFIDTLPVPIIQFAALVAPAATPLHARLKQEGRLLEDEGYTIGSFLETNIEPKLMSRAELIGGAKWTLNHIFAPEAFARRLVQFVELSPRLGKSAGAAPHVGPLERAVARRVASLGEGERRLLAVVEKLAWRRPDLTGQISYALLYYAQARYILDLYGIWDPDLRRRDRPIAA